MKKIGYIYRYNETEGKGILVYGYNWDAVIDKTCPIIFTKDDCISEVKTGQLVYFDYWENKLTKNIEHASLSNFKREILLGLVDLFKENNNWIEGKKATTIRYENLSDILETKPKIKDESKTKSNDGDNKNSFRRERGIRKINVTAPILKNENFFDYDDCFDDEEEENYYDDNFEMHPTELPSSIDQLYSFFGKYSHNKFRRNRYSTDTILSTNASCEIDILDLKHWIDKDVNLRCNYYGETVSQIADLYNLFIYRKVHSYNFENWRKPNRPYLPYSAPLEWKKLLNYKTVEELRNVCVEVPMLQPVLPRRFCIENLDSLTAWYGFPSVSICEAFFRYRIGITETTSDYEFLRDCFEKAIHSQSKHEKAEGALPCKLKKKVLRELKELLDNQYKNVVLNIIIQKLNLIGAKKINGEKIVQNHLNDIKNDYLLSLGEFIDNYEAVIDECDYSSISEFAKSYSKLIGCDKEALLNSVIRKSEECVSKIATSKYTEGKAELLHDSIRILKDFIRPEFLNKIRQLVNTEFSQLDNLKETEAAFLSRMISKEQYLSRYKVLTKDYSIEQFLASISNYESKQLPLSVQEYVIRTIFSRLNIKDLCTYRIEDHLYSLEGILENLKRQSSYEYIDTEILNKIIPEAIADLSKKDRWHLFEKKLIPSPLYDNIRERLDDAYKQNKIEGVYFQLECFQNVMVNDIICTNDYNRIFLILELLDKKHKEQVILSGSSTLKFFIWANEPNENIDIDLLKQYFYLLPRDVQIRIFKYLFYLKAKNNIDFSIPKLQFDLTGNNNFTICKELTVLLYLLEIKGENLSYNISNKVIRTMSGNEEIIDHSNDPFCGAFGMPVFSLKWNFGKLKEFFFDCYGYLLLSWKEFDIEYYSNNGIIEKVIIDNELFYSITFYERPIDFYGRYVDYLDEKKIIHAKCILEQNLPYKMIGNRYLIPGEYVIDVKEFVIDYNIKDCCNLFNDQSTLPIHTNYHVKYKDNDNVFCKCNKTCHSEDPTRKIPFCWCDKQPCTRLGKFFVAIDDWEKYKFVDLLNILYHGDDSVRDAIWNADAEIAQFLNNIIKNPKEISDSYPINIEQEIGIWTEEMRIVSEKIPEEENNEDDEDFNNYNDDTYVEEKSTYGRFAGSYAQDEMGYSDDDIDTIFDGDPDAYWNID